jgi:hypothetical protein
MAGAYPQAAKLRADADKTSATFSKCERTCLDVGARLGDAIPKLSDLGQLFGTLSQSLENADFQEANSDLYAVASDIEIIGRELTTESKGLVHLLGLNKAIAAQIENISANIRTITALVFNVKIEAASFTATVDNMTDFVEGLQFLAVKAQRAVEEYQSTHMKLYDLLESTGKTQSGFQKSHQDRLLSIASEITGSLETITQRRREIATALAEIGTQSQRIGSNIAQGVVALQAGDSTRQRIEHAQAALNLAADILQNGRLPAAATGLHDDASWNEWSSIAAAVCRLQSLQLDGAIGDFTQEMNTIASLLQDLAEDAGTLASRGLALCGSDDKGTDSFLDELERKLKGVNVVVEESRYARSVVDRAAGAVSMTMEEMEKQTASLAEIVVDMTMLGMNAVLKSTRLGQRGKGLNIIAQELRNYAMEVVQGIKLLKPSIEEVTTFVAQFSQDGEARGAEHMMTLGSRMTASISVFRSSGTQMTESLIRLQRESNDVGQLLDSAATQLGSSGDISETLLEVIASINELSAQIGDPCGAGPQGATCIDQILRGIYTMAREREIHDGFVYQIGGESSLSFATSPPHEDVEEFLF